MHCRPKWRVRVSFGFGPTLQSLSSKTHTTLHHMCLSHCGVVSDTVQKLTNYVCIDIRKHHLNLGDPSLQSQLLFKVNNYMRA